MPDESKEIKYICFDIGGVANVRMPNYTVVSLANKHFGKIFSEEDFKKITRSSDKDYWRKFQNGDISSEIYLERVLEAGTIPVTGKNKELLRGLLKEWCGVPYQPVLDLVETLKQQGYRTSILSNNNEIMYNAPAAEIKNRVDVAISSHEIGVSKPHWDAYCILLGKIKAETPGEVLFIDDEEHNIEAAKGYGLRGFLFRSKEAEMNVAFIELLQYLQVMGIGFSNKNV